jgi:hypothetical protein
VVNEINNGIQSLRIEKPLANPYGKRIPRLGRACKKGIRFLNKKIILAANEFLATTRK